MVGTHLDLKSRSPKSLQSKNTKKLSLNISQEGHGSHSMVMVEPPGRPWKQRDAGSARGLSFKQSRSEAQIYTLPLVSPGAEGVDVSPDAEGYKEHDESIHRGQSLKLTIETGSLPAVPPVGLERLRMRSLSSSNAARYESAEKRDRMQEEACAETLSWVFHKSDTPQEERRALVFSEGTGAGQYEEDEEEAEVHSFNSSLNSYVDVLNGSVYMGEPLCVIEPNVFLYSEPTLEQVLKFDLVINVAKEITNFAPQIPASSSTQYYHFQWSHTSKICSNLEEITELMHSAVRRNQRVLVHCQCGVSRSASLIVGYIMRYQSMSLNDAYNHLKKIAKYISPNMNLIFQLLEWGDRLKNGGVSDGTTKPSFISSSPTCSMEKHEVVDVGLDSRDDMGKPSLSSPNGSSVLSSETTPRTPRDFMSSTLSTSFTSNLGSVGSASPTGATNKTNRTAGDIPQDQTLGMKKDSCLQCSVVLSTYPGPSSELVNDDWRNI